MPGIAGLISRQSQAPDTCRRFVNQMLASMQHEKFYASGSYWAPELGVFAGWVALEDSFSRRQPLVSERCDVALLFSGECFADPDALVTLKKRGYPFEGNESAWLLALYDAKGVHFFEDLNGLFSGLLIDKRQRKAFLFNDRYGMERVYYYEGRDSFYFASEAKALLSILPELRAFDEVGLAQFLHYGCTFEGKTLFHDVQLLPGASLWSFAGGTCEKRRYFVPATWESQPPLTASAFQAEFQKTFAQILPRYFQSDSDIGISLTAGLDTRMIMTCRPETAHRVVSYTFAGREEDTLDARLAAQVASTLRIPHHVLRVGDDFFADFAALSDRTVYVTDGCFGICGTHEIYLNKLARDLSPIRITGNYGSEILRGHTTFKSLNLSADLFDRQLGRRLSEEPFSSTEAGLSRLSLAAFREIPGQLFGVCRAAQSQVTTRTPYLDNDLVALTFRAPEELRQSPAPALELIRSDHRGLDRIPTDQGLVPASKMSSFVRSSWYQTTFKFDYRFNDGMPHWLSFFDSCVLNSRLSRFGCRRWLRGSHRFLHYRRWLRTDLAGYVRDRLTDPRISQSPLWNRTFLERLAKDHTSGRKNYVREINAVLTLEAIERLLLRQDPAMGTQ